MGKGSDRSFFFPSNEQHRGRKENEGKAFCRKRKTGGEREGKRTENWRGLRGVKKSRVVFLMPKLVKYLVCHSRTETHIRQISSGSCRGGCFSRGKPNKRKDYELSGILYSKSLVICVLSSK